MAIEKVVIILTYSSFTHSLIHACTGIASRELARLYRENGNKVKAAECYHKHLNTIGFNQSNSNIDPEKAEGIMFLANYHRNKSDLTHAEEYCTHPLTDSLTHSLTQ